MKSVFKHANTISNFQKVRLKPFEKKKKKTLQNKSMTIYKLYLNI